MQPLVYVYQKDGVRYRVRLEIDAICKLLVERAARSKTGKAQMLHGDIKCERVRHGR